MSYSTVIVITYTFDDLTNDHMRQLVTIKPLSEQVQ